MPRLRPSLHGRPRGLRAGPPRSHGLWPPGPDYSDRGDGGRYRAEGSGRAGPAERSSRDRVGPEVSRRSRDGAQSQEIGGGALHLGAGGRQLRAAVRRGPFRVETPQSSTTDQPGVQGRGVSWPQAPQTPDAHHETIVPFRTCGHLPGWTGPAVGDAPTLFTRQVRASGLGTSLPHPLTARHAAASASDEAAAAEEVGTAAWNLGAVPGREAAVAWQEAAVASRQAATACPLAAPARSRSRWPAASSRRSAR